jgi:hypothetical protein
VYPGDSVIDTTYGLSAGGVPGTNNSPAGANITIGGNLEGTSGGGSKNIEFIAGTAGDVTIVGNAGGLQRLGIVLVTNANDVTVNNVTANRFLQRTGTGTTTTNGTIDTNGSETFSVTDFQPDNVAATGGTLSRTFGVNLVTTQIVINSEIITSSGGVHLSATDGTNVGVVTLNNNGRIRSDLDVILQGEASIGIVINALGTARFGAPGSGDVLTGTQRDFVTTSGAANRIPQQYQPCSNTQLPRRQVYRLHLRRLGGSFPCNFHNRSNSFRWHSRCQLQRPRSDFRYFKHQLPWSG